MQGEAVVQSPAIGNALRQVLSLDAAGGLPLEASQTVHPVVIVGDVRAQLDSNVRTFSGWRQSVGVAAQFPVVGIGLTSAPPSSFLYAIPRTVTLYAGITTFVYWRLGLNTPPVGTDAVPRQLNSSLALSGAIACHGGANAAAVTASTMNGLFYLPAATPTRIVLPEMRIYAPTPFATLAGLIFQGDVANNALIGEFVWDEYYR